MASFIEKQHTCRNLVTQVNTAVTSTAAYSTAAFGSETYQIRIATLNAPIAYVIEKSVVASVATGSVAFLPANLFEYVTVTPGQQLSAIVASGTVNAVVSITELG